MDSIGEALLFCLFLGMNGIKGGRGAVRWYDSIGDLQPFSPLRHTRNTDTRRATDAGALHPVSPASPIGVGNRGIITINQ